MDMKKTYYYIFDTYGKEFWFRAANSLQIMNKIRDINLLIISETGSINSPMTGELYISDTNYNGDLITVKQKIMNYQVKEEIFRAYGKNLFSFEIMWDNPFKKWALETVNIYADNVATALKMFKEEYDDINFTESCDKENCVRVFLIPINNIIKEAPFSAYDRVYLGKMGIEQK